jgi:hypothetical protein
MGRPKIDKESIDYISNHLFYKDILEGFQFTAGRTVREVSENEPFNLNLSLNFSKEQGVVIDCAESELKEKMMNAIFPKFKHLYRFNISEDAITRLGEIFNELGYEIDGAEFVGEWFWFRVYCPAEDISHHVNVLKKALKGFKLN